MLSLRYGGRAPAADPRVLTNLGNLYDEIGRPVEAINYYDRALEIDASCGMALGNKAIAVETLGPITRYPNSYYIYAHQLYRAAFTHEQSVLEVGGQEADRLGHLIAPLDCAPAS